MKELCASLVMVIICGTTFAQYNFPYDGTNYKAEIQVNAPSEVTSTSAKLEGACWIVAGHQSSDYNMAGAIQWSKTKTFEKFSYSKPGPNTKVINTLRPLPREKFSAVIGGLDKHAKYYVRVLIYRGQKSNYTWFPSTNIVSFTTLYADDGSVPIINNQILTPSQVICEPLPKGQIVKLLGSTPGGGLKKTYTYTWQTSTTGVGGWISAPGTANGKDYNPSTLQHSKKTTEWYRRKITSGEQTSTSPPMSITYLPSTAKRKIDLLNISQSPLGSSATTLTLLCTPIPNLGDHVTEWLISTEASTGPFKEIPGKHGPSSLSVKNPNTSTWYKAKVHYYSSVEEKCVFENTPAVGFSPPDGNGNIYPTAKIGEQTWMIHNLRATKYNDKTDIPEIKSKAEWKNAKAHGYCWYDNDKTSNEVNYGAMYNGYVVSSSKNVCPKGWHIATKGDWDKLNATAGGVAQAAGKLKSTMSGQWSPNMGTNTLNFNGLPGGFRTGALGAFMGKRTMGTWWMVPPKEEEKIHQMEVMKATLDKVTFFTSDGVKPNHGSYRWGGAIRCVKD